MRRFFPGLRGRLLILLLTLLVPMAAVQFITGRMQVEQRITQELNARSELAQGVRTAFLTYVGRIWDLQFALGTAILERQSPELVARVQDRLDELRGDPSVLRNSWLGPDGRLVATSFLGQVPPEARDLSDRPYVQRMMAGEDRVISDLITSRMDGRLVIMVAHAFRRDGKLVGAIISTVDPYALEQVLPITPRGSAVFGVADTQGQVVYRVPRIDWPLDRRRMTQGPAFEALQGKESVSRHFTSGIDGEVRMGVGVPIDGIGWAAFAGISRSEVAGPAMTAYLLQSSILVLTGILGILLALAIAENVLGPLKAFSAAAQTAADGDLTVQVPESSLKEVAAAGSAFNLMTRQIRDRELAERESYTRELERRHQRLRTLMDHMSEGVIALDEQQRVWVANGNVGAMLGVRHPEPGQLLSELGLPEALSDAIRNSMFEREGRSLQSVRAAGRHFDIHLSPVHSDRGLLLGVVILIWDVTSAVQARRMQQMFVANVSHEIRSPLASISVAAEALRDGMVPQQDRGRFFEVMFQQIRRMQRMAADLLDLSRLDAGNFEVQIERVELSVLFVRIGEAWRGRCDAAGLELQVAPSNLTILGDPDRLEQVLGNFLDNAVRFTPSGGRLEVRAEPDQGGVRVSVSDTGSGIQPEHLPLVWERFYTTDPARTRNAASGTGLGLSIAQQLVERMGGVVGVRSMPGEGSTFFFWLPAAAKLN